MNASTPPDDLDVRLHWPEVEETTHATTPRRRQTKEQRAAASRGADVTGPEPDPEASALDAGPSMSTELAVQFPALDTTHAALASIALRLDALTSATALLRNSINDRLTEYGEQTLRAQASSGRDLEDYKRLQDRSLTDIEAGLSASEEALHRLERSTTEAMDEFDRVSRHFDVRLDRVQELVGALAERPASEPPDLSPIHHALAGIEDVLDVLARRPETPSIDLAPLHRTMAGIQDSLETLSQRPAPPAIDLAPVQRTLTALQEGLERLSERPAPPAVDLAPVHSTLTALQESLERLSQRPAPPAVDLAPVHSTLAGIEEVLDDMAGRPTLDLAPVDRGLTRLEAAIDEIGGRVDLSRIEAELGELRTSVTSRSAPTEVMAALTRLQEAVDAVAAGPEADIEQTLTRVSRAQAEDVERVLAAVVEVGARQVTVGDDLRAMSKAQQTTTRSQLAALSDLQDRLEAIEEGGTDQRRPDVEAIVREVAAELFGRLDSTTTAVIDEVQAVTKSVDALRRRMAVRARNESAFNEKAISALADAVARRLSKPSAPNAPAADVSSASGRRRGPRA